MSPLRIAVVCRSFWPLAGRSELAISGLVQQLHLAGIEVQVVTSQWDASWCTHFEFGEVLVTRIARTGAGIWSSNRYARGLCRWLAAKCEQWDAVIVVGGLEELEAAIRARDNGGPKRVFCHLDQSLLHRLKNFPGQRKKILSALATANKLVLADATLQSEFEALVGTSLPIQWIPNGVGFQHLFDESHVHDKQRLRASMSDIHPLMELNRHHIVGVHMTDFRNEAGLHFLVDVWATVAHKNRNARLWLIGDGTQAREVWRQINDLSLVEQVVMAGNFDNDLDAYLVGDFYVQPELRCRSGDAIAQAAACGLPSVHRTMDGAPEWFRAEQHGCVAPNADIGSFVEVVSRMVTDSPFRIRCGAAAQETMLATRSWSGIISAWRNLACGSNSTKEASVCES